MDIHSWVIRYMSDGIGISFRVDGEPVPKQSTRFDGKGHAHTDPRVRGWQEHVMWKAKEAVNMIPGGFMAYTCDLMVILTFYLGNKRRVDLDNLSKCVLDGMSGIIYADDRQVINLVLSKKINKENPGVEVMVYEYKTEEHNQVG